MAEKTKVLLIDDHPFVLEGLKTILENEPLFEIVGEAGDGETGFRLALEQTPDVVVVDIALPDLDGLQLTRKILAALPQSRVLVISMHSDADYLRESLRAGAKGYVLKGSKPAAFLRGLQCAADGHYFIDEALAKHVTTIFCEAGTAKPLSPEEVAYATLTPREQEVLRLVAEGNTNKEIAELLGISVKTADNHRTSILGKLNLHSAVEVTHYAARLGLINLQRVKS